MFKCLGYGGYLGMMNFGNSDHSSLTLRLHTLDGTARGRGCKAWAGFGSIQALRV